MKKMINIIMGLSCIALLITSCEEDIPEQEISSSVNEDFLNGKWFLNTINELGGTYSATVTDKDGAVIDTNATLEYVLSTKNQSSPFEVNFDLIDDVGTLDEFGSYRLDYSVFDGSDFRTSFNGEEALPQRPVVNTRDVFEGDVLVPQDERERTLDLDARLKKELSVNYSTLFANTIVSEKSFKVELVNDSTIRLSYTALIENSDGSLSNVPSTLDLNVIFVDDTTLRVKYKTTENTIRFGANIFAEAFETGTDFPFSPPFFETEKIITPTESNFTGEVELIFTRGKVITDEVLEDFDEFLLNLVQKDTEGNLLVEVSNPIVAFDKDELLSSLSYVTESGNVIGLSNPRFVEGSNNQIIKLDAAEVTNEIASLNYNPSTVGTLLDHFDNGLSSFSSPLFPFNFFRGTFHDFSNPNEYNLGDQISFGLFNGNLKPGNDSVLNIVEDVPDDALNNSQSFQLLNRPANNSILAWPQGGRLELAPGEYRILFHAKSTEPINLKLILPGHWCKSYAAKLKDSTDTITQFGTDWAEYEIGPFELDPNSTEVCPNGVPNLDGDSKALFIFRFDGEQVYDEYTALFYNFRLNLVGPLDTTTP